MTPRILLLACLAFALTACAGGRHSVRAGSSGALFGGAMDDGTITVRVKTVLLNDPQVSAAKIDVSTNGGIVTLSGSVKSKADELRAIDLARRVTGVRDVKSTLILPVS